jgi:hypothetical protein
MFLATIFAVRQCPVHEEKNNQVRKDSTSEDQAQLH